MIKRLTLRSLIISDTLAHFIYYLNLIRVTFNKWIKIAIFDDFLRQKKKYDDFNRNERKRNSNEANSLISYFIL